MHQMIIKTMVWFILQLCRYGGNVSWEEGLKMASVHLKGNITPFVTC